MIFSVSLNYHMLVSLDSYFQTKTDTLPSLGQFCCCEKKMHFDLDFSEEHLKAAGDVV